MVNAQEWLDQNYPAKERKKIKKLNLWSGEIRVYLEGSLKLEGFSNLRSFECSDNYLTQLDLSECEKLTYLNVCGNKFTNLSFLNSENENGLPHPEKVEELWIRSNKNLFLQNSDFLRPFTGLIILGMQDCPLYGSLEPLKDMDRLYRINISHTDIDSGLEYLPESCQILQCEFGYQSNKKSVEIAKMLGKYLITDYDPIKHNACYYDLNKWREDKQNRIALVIPLERLFVIRSNIKQFLKKWGIKKDESNLNEINKLQSPEELWKNQWTIYGAQFAGRGLAVAGAILTFQDQGAIGGGILAVYPFAELAISKLEESLKNKEDKWKEFLADGETFLENYHELLGILSQFKTNELKGKLNETLENLNKKTEEFSNIYDEDNNKEIDVEELKEKRVRLAQDLDKWSPAEKEKGEEEGEKSKLQEIIDAIENLEKAVIEYRKSSYYGTIRKEGNETENQSEKNNEAIVADEELEIQIEIPPK